MADKLDTCARELLDVMPLVMQDLRRTMRGHASPDLRVPELRSLAFLRHSPGSNLTDLAEHIGVSLPSMSKLVDTLAYRGFIDRQSDPDDRRRVRLRLTTDGLAVLSVAREAVKTAFAVKLARLDASAIETVTMGLRHLRQLFDGSLEERGAPRETEAAGA
jgi:MarR family transcriptional regulator for hemolysin